jgi:hypothetical protein
MFFSCLCLNQRDMDSHFHKNPCCSILYSILALFLSTNVVWMSCMQHVQEFLNYAKFVSWWVSLGVASSIGLGKLYFRTSKH